MSERKLYTAQEVTSDVDHLLTEVVYDFHPASVQTTLEVDGSHKISSASNTTVQV